MIQIFSLTLAANEAREVAVSGEYFELRNAVYPVALIELLDRAGGVVSRLENPEQSDFVKPGRYETIRITNGPTAQTIKHFYGSGDAGSRRTSGLVQVDGTVAVVGNVSVIDGEKARTLSGGMYAASALQAALAANYPAVQLWNPVGSGKNIIVSTVSAGSSSTTGAVFYIDSVEYATDITAARASNKMSGAAMGVGKVKADYFGSLPSYAGKMLRAVNVPAGSETVWDVRGAIVINPGYALNVIASDTLVQILSNMEWFEEAI